MYIRIAEDGDGYKAGATYNMPALIARKYLSSGKGALVPKSQKPRLSTLETTEPVKKPVKSSKPVKDDDDGADR